MFTINGNFSYRGRTSFIDGLISLLVSLKVSGVRLTQLNANGFGTFIESGVVTFVVSGSEAEVDKFKVAFNA
jgi:hypothetical protein